MKTIYDFSVKDADLNDVPLKNYQKSGFSSLTKHLVRGHYFLSKPGELIYCNEFCGGPAAWFIELVSILIMQPITIC